MRNKMKKFFIIIPWVALIVLGVWFSSQALSDWIVDEFVVEATTLTIKK